MVTRAVVMTLDVSPSEERLLVSYCGARRFAYNWVLGVVTENLAVRRAERAAGVAEDRLTPSVSWSAHSLDMRWHRVRDEVAPWWQEVSMHAFRSGIVDAAAGLKNWSDWRAVGRRTTASWSAAGRASTAGWPRPGRCTSTRSPRCWPGRSTWSPSKTST